MQNIQLNYSQGLFDIGNVDDLHGWDVQSEAMHTAQGIEIPNAYAITRNDNQAPIGIVGRQYQLLSNEVFLSFIQDYCQVAGGQLETGGVLRNGSVVWGLVNNGESDIGNNDGISKYTIFKNAHDGSSPFYGGGTTIRPSCTNTLNAAFKEKAGGMYFKIPHTISIEDRVEQARKVMQEAESHNITLIDTFRKMSQFKMSERQMIDFLNDKLITPTKFVQENTRGDLPRNPFGSYPIRLPANPKREKMLAKQEEKREEKIESIIGLTKEGLGAAEHGGNTAWALFNGISEWADHHREIKPSENRTAEEGRVESVLWGRSAEIKSNAYNLLADIIKA